jgi:uncharacterized protein YecE (DUF72 family)
VALLIGTSGWSYPSGRGTWNGLFYPASRPKGFDELAYYAEHFDTVEVNSTFYRVPEPELTRRWARRTPESFTFSVKLYQKFTHPDMYLSRQGVTDWDVSPADLDQFRLGIDPLASAGKLTALLLQFPASFHAEPETRAYLEWLLEALDAYPLAVELRHRSWSDEADRTRASLGAHRAAWVVIDEPKFAESIAQSLSAEAGLEEADHGAPFYVRLHGRNAQLWWRHAESDDRYDYLYTPEELTPFADAARRAARTGRRVLMYLNNHFSAKAVANAAILAHQVEAPARGEYPRALVERYPALAGIVRIQGLPI